MDTKQALDLIKQETEQARVAIKNASPRKRGALQNQYRRWLACLDICTEIYHADEANALERIMALKLHTKLST